MNDDELDLWLSTQNAHFDAQVNARISVELRRHQVRSAAAPEPRDGESDIAEAHAIWSGEAVPAGSRSRHSRVSSACGLRPSMAAVLVVVLCLLVPSAVIGDLISDGRVASAPREQGKSMIIGVPVDVPSAGMAQETHGYAFAYGLANWLADDLHYSPKTLYTFSDIDPFPDDHRWLLQNGQVDMVITPKAVTGQRGAEFSFAGPYMLTQGGVLVRSDSAPIRTIGDLDGRRVCTWGESTYKAESMRLGKSVPVEKDFLSACVDSLLAGGVDAVAGDQLVLARIAHLQKENHLAVVPGVNFGDRQRYGIELDRDKAGDCEEVRDAIRRFITSGAWDKAFQAAMPGVPPAVFRPDPGHLDRCG